jgi:peptidoglycan/LPS O-acetylase OafA/YrhL
MVALFHIGLTPYVDAMGHQQRLIARSGDFSLGDAIARILGNGPGAVIFFFVLSGFVLTKVLKNGPSNAGQNSWQFLTGRIFRLYPAILSTLTIFIAIFLVSGHSLTGADEFKPTSLLLNALLIRPTIDSVMWSLQLELIAAPMLLLIYFAWHALSAGKAAIRTHCRSCRSRRFTFIGLHSSLARFTLSLPGCLHSCTAQRSFKNSRVRDYG